MRLYRLVVISMLMPFLLVVQAGEAGAGRGPSVSVGDMIDAMLDAGVPRLAIRGQFISELVQTYECQVQTRWFGLEVVTEKTIDEMAYIDSLRVPADEIQTADYVISGNYSSGGSMSTRGNIFCADLRAGGERKALQGSFEVESSFEIPERMAKTVASLLSLPPHKPADGRIKPAQQELVWVICPFLRCTPGWGVDSTTDATLSLHVEASLQKQGIVKKLVDRQTLDGILKEHHMAALSEQGHESARTLARLTKADILLTGQVAPLGKNFRIDLFLLDSRTGGILAACTAKDIATDQLASECVRLAVRLAEMPIVMPALSPSTPAQRRREAEVLISREHYPADPGDMFFFTRVLSELESLINAAEGAYLLVHDDPAFVYRSITALQEGYKRRGGFNTPPDGRIERSPFKALVSMQRIACLINQALQSMEHSEKTPFPLLVRADALLYAGRYKEALALADDHMKRYPGLEEGWALEILAESNYRLGNADLALDLAKRSLSKQPASWFTPNIVSEVTNSKLKNVVKETAGKSDRETYEAYRKLLYTTGAKITIAEWKQYLELMRKIEGPEKSLEVQRITPKCAQWWGEKHLLYELPGPALNPDKLMGFVPKIINEGGSILRVMMLHVAQCYAETGQKERAARRCRDIVADADTVRYFWAQDPAIGTAANEAEALCGKLEKEIGPVSELWRTGRDVRPFDGRYHIYLVPLADFDMKKIAEAMKHLSAFFGDDVVRILPEVSAPASAMPAGDNNYRAKPFFGSVLKMLVVPDDALHVVFLTGRPAENGGLLCAGQADNSNDPKILSPVLISYLALQYGNMSGDVGIRNLAWKIMSSFNYTYEDKRTTFWMPFKDRLYGNCRQECRTWTCVFSTPLIVSDNAVGLRLTMCPECQKKYKKADFDKIHSDLMDYLKKTGAKIVPAESWTRTAIELCQTGKVMVVASGQIGTTVSDFVTQQGVPARTKTTATVRWDDAGLTVHFECEDKTIVTKANRPRDDGNIWKDDGAEVFVDIGHTHSYSSRWIHVLLTAAGGISDDSGPAKFQDYSSDPYGGDGAYTAAGLKTKVDKAAVGWRGEMFIPWSDLGARPEPGDVWGFNLNRTNWPEEEYLCWSPTKGLFMTISQWGHIIFANDAKQAEQGLHKMQTTHSRDDLIVPAEKSNQKK